MDRPRFVVALTNQDHYQQQQALAARETAARLEVDLEVIHADNDFLVQDRQLLELVQKPAGRERPDAILVEPLAGTGYLHAAELAVAAGIGWAVLNCDENYVARLRRTAKAPIFVVTRDHAEIGRVQGRQFAALLPRGGTLLYLQGPIVNAAALLRTDGMMGVKPAHIEVKAIRSQWTTESARQAVAAWLALQAPRVPLIDVVGCQSDGIALGARKALDEQTRGPDRDRWLSLPFTGVDGLVGEGQAWVDQGLLAATVASDVTTRLALELLVDAMKKGNQPPARSLVPVRSYPAVEQLAAGLGRK